MARAIRALGDIFLFLSGLVVGVILTAFEVAPVIAGRYEVEEINGLLLLPDVYYIVAVVGFAGLSLLLRRAAMRVV